MKKYILSIAIFFAVSACNDSAPPPGTEPATVLSDTSQQKADSSPADKTDDTLVKTGNTLGSGLTLEEMKDDTVFSDGSRPTSWEVAGINDARGFKLFLKQVQLLVLNNDKEQLAKLIRYPLHRSAKTEKDFINNYDRIFSKAAKLSIAKINFSQIFRNNKGVMSEDGKVWFAQDGNGFKIIAINN